MFFTYRQNNSGGSFDHEPGKYGFAVVIEAETAEEANTKAEDLGLYFDGESDCPCCGRRWAEADAVDAKAEPEIYGQPLAKNAASDNRFGWWGLPIYVHYLDGRVEKHEHIRDERRHLAAEGRDVMLVRELIEQLSKLPPDQSRRPDHLAMCQSRRKIHDLYRSSGKTRSTSG